MNLDSKIFIAGHKGMVGSSLYRYLKVKGYKNIITKTSHELDLRNQNIVKKFFKENKPEYVFLAAAKVGGIKANNKFRADFIYDNLQIQNNVIHFSHINNVKKLLFFGSSCIYPKNSPQPIKEDSLLTGLLEYTNEPYAIAKIAGIKMCENYYKQYKSNFISVMPTNLYGPNDNYDLDNSHVMPALIRKMHILKCLERDKWELIIEDFSKHGMKININKSEIMSLLEKYGIKKNDEKEYNKKFHIKLWGSGEVYREFLHVDDMISASMLIFKEIDAHHLYEDIEKSHINIGSGDDITIKNLSNEIKNIINVKSDVLWDNKNPDGVYKKQLDISLLKSYHWSPQIPLTSGIKSVYSDYIK